MANWFNLILYEVNDKTLAGQILDKMLAAFDFNNDWVKPSKL